MSPPCHKVNLLQPKCISNLLQLSDVEVMSSGKCFYHFWISVDHLQLQYHVVLLAPGNKLRFSVLPPV